MVPAREGLRHFNSSLFHDFFLSRRSGSSKRRIKTRGSGSRGQRPGGSEKWFQQEKD